MTHRFTSRRAVAVAAILALAACGSDDGVTDTAGSNEQPPVTSGSDGAVARAPTPIEVVSGGASQTGTVAGATADAEVAVSDMMIAPWNVEYLVGDALPALPADDTGYVFIGQAGGSAVTADEVARIAAVFAVEGEPVAVDEGFGVNWRVGPDDGSGPNIWVASDGPQGWNYSAPWAEAFESCAVSVDAEGNETSDCPEPQPPAGVPPVDEAEQRTRELLATLGVDVAGVSFESFGDEWFTSVEVSDDTDPRAPVRSWNFGFGGDGALQYAGGPLATPERVGPYPLVDLETAIARLSDGFYGGFAGGGIAIAEPALPTVGEAETVPIEDDAVVAEPAEPIEPIESSEEPMPVEPLPGGEPVVVELVDVRADLWWAWDSDGSAWLLPAYRFVDTDGGWHVVPAVSDEYLIRTDPVVIDGPIPVEPDGGIGDGAEPLPTPETPLDAVGGLVYAAGAALVAEYVGLPLAEFEIAITEVGYGPVRIAWQNGEYLPVEDDLRPGRVDVAIANRDGVDVVIDAFVEVDPDAPDAIDVDPGADPEVATSVLDEFVGLSIEEFTAEAQALGFTTRIVVQDGEALAVTADYSETRVNVEIEGPRVVAIVSIG